MSVKKYGRLRKGAFYADFRLNTSYHPEIYHCILQRDGCMEIISLTQFHTLHAAVSAATAELKRLASAAEAGRIAA